MVIASPILHHHTISCSFFFAWNFFQPHPASSRYGVAMVRWRKKHPQGLSLTFRYGVSSWNSLPKLPGEELRLSGDRGGPALWGQLRIMSRLRGELAASGAPHGISYLQTLKNHDIMRSVWIGSKPTKKIREHKDLVVSVDLGGGTFQEKMSLLERVWEAKPPESQKASCGRICL